MAAEAEAAREARAKVVAAEGEQKASLHLKEAALVLEESTSALQLRYLQVIDRVGDWGQFHANGTQARFVCVVLTSSNPNG